MQRFRADGTDVDAPVPWRNWLWLVRHAPSVARPAGRNKWIWVFGTCVGSAQGAWRTR